jgi:hypothetical protein
VKPTWRPTAEISAPRRLRQKDGEFKPGLGYIVCSKPAWATKQDSVSKNQTKQSAYMEGMEASIKNHGVSHLGSRPSNPRALS